jgi:hypothetical protein
VSSRPSTLRDALIALGVKADDLDALSAWAPYKGLGLAERVYRAGLVSDHRLVEAFGMLGATDATARVLGGTPPPAALGAFTRALAEKHRALPLEIDRRRLIVALLDPSDTATLEKLSFTCGLVIEPRACRPRVLFEGLARAYDLVVVKPDGAFLESRRAPAPASEDMGFDLPPPSTDALATLFSKQRPADDRSPMARVLMEAADVAAGAGIDIDVAAADDDLDAPTPRSALLLPRRASDLRPSITPRIDEAALGAVRALSSSDAVAARDSLPPMVLGLLVPPLRCCALFVVRQNIAVGWDARTTTGTIATADVRDVLVPLTAESVLATAARQRRVALGHARDPTTMERTLFRFLRLPPPRSFAALPILVGDDVTALLYADRDDGVIDDVLLDEMRRVGAALGDAVAPLAAAGLLGAPPRP